MYIYKYLFFLTYGLLENIILGNRTGYLITQSLYQMSSLLFAPLILYATATAKSLQLCPTLCDPVPGILQARTLEGVSISFSNAWKWKWSCSVMSDSSWPHGLQPTRLLHPWDFPGKSTGVGCHCLPPYFVYSTYILCMSSYKYKHIK